MIVEATNYMETSDEIHSRELAWDSTVEELRRIIRPLPVSVTVRPVGTPEGVQFRAREVGRVRRAVEQAVRTQTEVSVPFEGAFSMGIEADPDPLLAGRGRVASQPYEPDGGVIRVPQKLHQITRKVRDKANKYAAFPRPLVVVMNCPTAFRWYDEYEEIEPLTEKMRGIPCDAVWLFCNLQPSNIGFCEHHLLENPDSPFGETGHLAPIRDTRGNPLHEVLGLGLVWNRVVAFDRYRTPDARVVATS